MILVSSLRSQLRSQLRTARTTAAHRPSSLPSMLARRDSCLKLVRSVRSLMLCVSGLGLWPTSRAAGGFGRQASRRTICTAVPPLLPRLAALCGPVMLGYGRGSSKLGFPTANLPCSLFQDTLGALDTGVYLGWAGLGGEVRKCVANVGFSPSFVGQENPEKIVEAHIIAEGQPVPKDFYGEPLRLLLLGYVRPERRFDFSKGPGELIAAISADVKTATARLDDPEFRKFREAPWLVATVGKPSFELMEPSSILREG